MGGREGSIDFHGHEYISENIWKRVTLDCENHPERWPDCKTQTVKRQSRNVIPKTRTSSDLPCSILPTLSNTFGRSTGKKPALSFSGNHDLIKCSVGYITLGDPRNLSMKNWTKCSKTQQDYMQSTTMWLKSLSLDRQMNEQSMLCTQWNIGGS